MSASTREEFAGLLNQARIERHLSIGSVARMASVPKATAQGWLNGSHLPTPALRPQFLHLVEILGLSNELPDGLWLGGWGSIEPRLRGPAPYLGLRQFGVDDVDYYFGREAEARRLAEAVAALDPPGAGIIALVGPSGSGKSSLLAAGLVARECATGLLAGRVARVIDAADLGSTVGDAELVAIDQLEEVFLLDDEPRREALERLGGLASTRVVVVGLRSDAFGDAQAEPLLADALSRPVLVSPLTRSELLEVVVGPAHAAGVAVDGDLVPLLLADLVPTKDAGLPPDLLPLLSNALLVTWAAGRGGRMTVADYQAAGGVAGAVETLAEQVYSDLGDTGQAQAQQLFLRLVTVVHGTAVRRSLPLAELGPTERGVLDAFVAARMLTITDEQVRISHDALVRHWSRLAGWIEEHRSDLAELAKLRRAAELWRDTGRDPEVLIPVDRLGSFGGWLDDPQRMVRLDPTERAFVDASESHFASALQAEQQTSRRLRRQRRIAVGLAVVTTLAATGAGISYARGEGFRAEAVVARHEAESRQVAVAARSLRTKSPNLVAQLALVSSALSNTQESRSVVMDARSMDIPLRWTGPANAVLAVSPNGQLVARGDGAGGVTLWRGAQLVEESGEKFVADPTGGGLLALAFGEVAGRQLLAVGGPRVRALWDVTEQPRMLADLSAASASSAAAFSPDAEQVAFGDVAGVVTVYSTDDPTQPRVVNTLAATTSKETPQQVSSIAFDRRGRVYVGGAAAGRISRWQLGSATRQLPELPVEADDGTAVRVQALAVSNDGRQLAAGVAGQAVHRWRLEPGPEKVHSEPTLTGFGSWINALSYSPDGSHLGVASSDQNVTLWDVSTGVEVRNLVTPAIQTGVGFTGEGQPVSVGTDGTLLVWDPKGPLWRVSGAPAYNLATAGFWLAAGTATDGIELWHTSGLGARLPDPVVPALPTGDAQRGAVAVAPSGSFLIGGTLRGRLLSWPLSAAGAGLGEVAESGSSRAIIYAAVSPDSHLVAAMEAQGTQVVLFSAGPSGHLTRLGKIEANTPQLVGFTADGSLLAIAEVNNRVSLWRVADPQAPVLAGRIEGLTSMPTTLTLAPRSPLLALGQSSGEVSLWDISKPAAPTRQGNWTEAATTIYSLAFSPDERQLIGTSGDDLIWGWDLTSASDAASFALSGDIGRPWDARFIDDGQRFAVSGSTGGVRVWTASMADARAQLCAHLGSPLSEGEWRKYLAGITPRPIC